MDITLLREPPAKITAGDSIEFLVAIPSEYSGWTGSARLTGPSQMAHTTCATENSDLRPYFRGQGSDPKTAGLTAGQYVLSVWLTSGNDRVTLAQFPITIEADLSTGTPAQVHARKMLSIVESAIEARIQGNTDGGIEEYQVEGVMVKKLSMAELQKLRSKYAAEVSALQNPNRPIGSVDMVFAKTGFPADPRYRQ